VIDVIFLNFENYDNSSLVTPLLATFDRLLDVFEKRKGRRGAAKTNVVVDAVHKMENLENFTNLQNTKFKTVFELTQKIITCYFDFEEDL
jgi:hypothetical protein